MHSNKHYLKILGLTLMMGLSGSPVMAADISVTSTFTSAGPNPNPPATCDATAGAGQGGYSTPDGTLRDWAAANSYCTSQGMRLPTQPELSALYSAYPDNQMAFTCGWPTYSYYWSSTQGGSGSHYNVYLSNGVVNTLNDNFTAFVACVR